MAGKRQSLAKGSSPTASPAMKAAVKLLGDGGWHSYHRVINAIARHVPPGVAVRHNERLRQLSSLSGGERVKSLTLEQQVRYGGLALARQVLNNKRRFEISPSGRLPAGEKKFVRLAPETLEET